MPKEAYVRILILCKGILLEEGKKMLCIEFFFPCLNFLVLNIFCNNFGRTIHMVTVVSFVPVIYVVPVATVVAKGTITC